MFQKQGGHGDTGSDRTVITFHFSALLRRWLQEGSAEAAVMLWIWLGGGRCHAVPGGPGLSPGPCQTGMRDGGNLAYMRSISRLWEKSSVGGCGQLGNQD